MVPLILASASPRRRQLLQQIGLDFRVVASSVSEALPPEMNVKSGVMELAYRKAKAVAINEEQGLVLGADTVVVLGDKVLGKPAGPEEACAILSQLQGKKHQVITGVAVLDIQSGSYLVEAEVTQVWMRKLTPRDIEGYVATGEPLDKAGAYAIQGKGALLVETINGCYFNVVGLPLLRVVRMLEKYGVDPWRRREEN